MIRILFFTFQFNVKHVILLYFPVAENLNTISEYLPKTVDELLGLNVDLPEYPRFDQCVSKGLSNTGKNFGLLPVFIIPGIGASRIQPLTKKIMHQVFCAKFPSYVNSIENAALSLLWVWYMFFFFIIPFITRLPIRFRVSL